MSKFKLELRERNEAVSMAFNKGYQQGKSNGVKDFVEALRVNFDLLAWNNSDEVIDYTLKQIQKGEES